MDMRITQPHQQHEHEHGSNNNMSMRRVKAASTCPEQKQHEITNNMGISAYVQQNNINTYITKISFAGSQQKEHQYV